MILSGLSKVRECLENLEKSGKLKKMSRKSGNFTNFVIYQGKVRKQFPAIYSDVKFPKMKCLFCQLALSLLKSYLRVATDWSGKVY